MVECSAERSETDREIAEKLDRIQREAAEDITFPAFFQGTFVMRTLESERFRAILLGKRSGECRENDVFCPERNHG